MGRFSSKFRQAARIAADLLEGTLYETYYGIDCGELRALPEQKEAKRSRFLFRRPSAPVQTSPTLAGVCQSRAGVRQGGQSVAANGMIIEQQQILTTQNLAPLFVALELRDALGAKLGEMARDCFRWVCKRLQVEAEPWHARLIQVKNSAYAWRQMVFFLALLPESEISVFLAWAEEHLNGQPLSFCDRFWPALSGLSLAANGTPPGDRACRRAGARPFLGWCKGTHWLLAGAERKV